MNVRKLRFATIDDHLGPSAGRFFGSGFTRVSHRVGDLVVDHDRESVTARAALHYPADWSTKSTSRSLTPHLSTIDAAVLSVLLGEAYLTRAFGLGAEARRTMWLRAFSVKAGVKPQEQLADFGISAAYRGTAVGHGGAVSTLECRLGGLRTRIEIVHDPGESLPGAGREVLPDDFLGDPARRYFGDGFRARRQEVVDVELDPDAAEASALVRITGDHDFPDGFGGDHQPSVSIVDGMVVLAQLAQSLLYRLDDIERGDSNTLWMRQVDVSTTSPHRPLGGEFGTTTSITRNRLLDFDGGRWRTTDWSAEFQGMHYAYRLAHRLPVARLVTL
ncbi:AvrD family protein [Saccharothrix violaceirubra]|uniref:Avirulence D protein (AvrD) n=1 Tax=Saccharothrix violaceirubra TaxID=413306 RepID=A0A7W7T2P5_9PSEU|nr:AvrD family protein [Saccharothrix violaceirubra]MBB4965458.1 hypothetical protein [Saccharothrix violaceirubra]